MVEGGKMSLIMNQGLSHAPGCQLQIPGDMEPAGVGLGMWRRTDVKMNIPGMGVID
jgi:hypothetical protein